MAEENTDAVDRGLFNFNELMSDFYGYEPDSEDDEGRALKRGFQADMVKKFADSQVAMQQAAQDQSFQMDATKQLADLELRNQTQTQKDMFDYGMQEMGARYDFESRMAVDDAARELNKMAMGGDITQNQTRLEGAETRATQKEGLQIGGAETRATQREGLQIGGQEERQTQREALEIGGQEARQTQREGIREQSAANLASIGKAGLVEESRIKAQKLADEYVMRATAGESRQTQKEGLEIGGQQERETVKTTAEEGRKTMGFADDLDAKKEQRATGRATRLAAR